LGISDVLQMYLITIISSSQASANYRFVSRTEVLQLF